MKRGITWLIVLLLFHGGGVSVFGQDMAGYMGIPWNSPFPVIEQHFPGVEFVEEDGFHVTLFQLMHPEKDVDRVEFKLFENKLISVLRYYKGNIDQLVNEKYIRTLVSGLGSIKEKRTTTANSLAGIATVEIYEYADILLLFRHYPPGQKEGLVAKENSIVIIYKPTFDKMVYYRKHSEGDVEEIIDYDYIEF
jgi:hypothetical protein